MIVSHTMYYTMPLICLSSLLFHLPLILSAPTLAPPDSDDCTNPEFSAYYIENLQIFTGPSTSSIHFRYANSASSIFTTCSRLIAGDGITEAAISVADTSAWPQCDNQVVAFNWDGTRLSIMHGWSCDGVR